MGTNASMCNRRQTHVVDNCLFLGLKVNITLAIVAGDLLRREFMSSLVLMRWYNQSVQDLMLNTTRFVYR